MSRRSRRRGNAGGAGWLGKAALGLILAGVLGAGVLYAMVRGYLHSDAFRRFLSEKVSEAAGVDGEFTPFRWDGLAVDTTAFEATGSGIVRELRVEGLHTEVGVGGVSRGVWEIQGSRVQRLELPWMRREAAQLAPPPAEKRVSRRPGSKKAGCLPRSSCWAWMCANWWSGRCSIKGSPRRGHEDAGGAVAVGRGPIGSNLPMGRSGCRSDCCRNSAWTGRSCASRTARFSSTALTAAAWKDGRLDCSGEWDRASGRYSLEGDVSGCEMRGCVQ